MSAPDPDLVTQDRSQAIRRRPPLDLLSATSLVAASMIGAGVYTTSGYTLADLGSPWWVMVAWAIGGVIAICGAVCYGSLAREMLESGGEYLFLSRALHPVAGLMAGVVSLLAGFTGALAFAATAFETYLGIPTNLPVGVIASLIIVLAAVLHTIGVRPGARVQDGVVIMKFILISSFLLIAAFSLLTGSESSREMQQIAPETSGTGIRFALQFATALVWISLSYSGFNAAVYVTGEVVNPEKTVPRAMFFGTLLVTVCYLLLNAVFVLGVPASEVSGQPDIAAKAAQVIGGQPFALLVRVIILFGLFTSVSALVMSGPRVYAKMADDGFLPAWFRFEHSPPIAAIVVQAILAIIVVHLSSLKQLLDYLGFTLSVSAALTASLLFWARSPRTQQRIAVPWYPIPPIVFVGGTLLTATLSAINSPKQAIAGLGTILLGAILYPVYKLVHTGDDT